jgi:hypothetical protein
MTVSISGVQIARASELQNHSNSYTNGTPNTDNAVALGSVPDAEMLVMIRNTDTASGHYILVRETIGGAARTIAKILPGEVFYGRMMNAPSIQSPVASVPYEAIVAAA